MKDFVQKKIRELEPVIIQQRRDFHKYPESGWTEFRTASIIVEKLQNLGYDVKYGTNAVVKEAMMGVPSLEELVQHMERAVKQGANPEIVKAMEGGLTGVVADLKISSDGPVIALRFDIDANDICEATDEDHKPYREGFVSGNPKVMHACGHDGHAAMGLGVAQILAEIKDKLKGTIRLIFEPGEEGSRGARAMVAAGAVEGVTHLLGGHIGFQAKKTGEIICGTGEFLATTKLDVTYRGVPAHAAAAPQEGRNALLAAATATLNLHAISRHGKGASRITVGTMRAGQGRNVIPPNAFFQMETRGVTSEIDTYMYEAAKKVIISAAEMYEVEYDIKMVGGTKSGESSPEMIARVKKIAESMDAFDNIREYLSFGATEDFSHFMSIVQENGGWGTYFMVGSDLAAGHHNFHFDFDENCLSHGTELIVRTVLDIIGGR